MYFFIFFFYLKISHIYHPNPCMEFAQRNMCQYNSTPEQISSTIFTSHYHSLTLTQTVDKHNAVAKYFQALAQLNPWRDETNSLINHFDFRVFMFQEMVSGDSIMITARVFNYSISYLCSRLSLIISWF